VLAGWPLAALNLAARCWLLAAGLTESRQGVRALGLRPRGL